MAERREDQRNRWKGNKGSRGGWEGFDQTPRFRDFELRPDRGDAPERRRAPAQGERFEAHSGYGSHGFAGGLASSFDDYGEQLPLRDEERRWSGTQGEQLEPEPVFRSFKGKGPKNFRRTDDRIRERVCEILHDDEWIDASEIEVSVADGEVTLTGSVDSRETKRLAEDAISDVPGVRDVHNRLRWE